MPLDTGSITDIAASGASGGIAGFLMSMYNKYVLDRKLERLDNRLDNTRDSINKEYITRAEVFKMHKESKEETHTMHRDLDHKLDKVLEVVNALSVDLAKKADKT